MARRLELLIAACLYYSGLVKFAIWWTQKSGKRLVILCYHCADGGDLRQHLLYLKKHYRILHLEAALEELYTESKDKSQQKNHGPLLVITFDDGYHDNYTYGFVLARELQVPITIFLIPGYIESDQRFWWQEPAQLLLHAQVSEVIIEGRSYNLHNIAERRTLVQAIHTSLQNAPSITKREEFLAALRKVLEVSVPANAKQAIPFCLSWAEIQEMEKSGWVSFGAHTMYHPVLACLADPADALLEARECRMMLERHLGHPVRTFAYPVGRSEHIGEQGLHAVQATKYDWALTTIHSVNTPYTNPYLLHRIIVDVDQHWLMVAAKASGAWDFFLGVCRTPITLIRSIFKSS